MTSAEPGDFSCLACSAAGAEPFLRDCRDYYLSKPYRTDYWKCRVCGLIQQYPLPEDTASFYDSYPIHQKKSLLHGFFRRIVMGPVYFKASQVPPGGRILDYGCGDGWFLEESHDRGSACVGFEPSPAHAAALAERLGIPVYSDPKVLAAEHAAAFDAITMHFALEHVTDLDGTVALLSKLLKPGGTVYIVVPNLDSLEARLFGRYWHNLDPPRHICFPTAATIRALCRRHGLALIGERSVPFPNGIAGSLAVVLSGRFRFGLFLAFLPLSWLLTLLFPDGNRAYLLRREPPEAGTGIT